MMMNMKKIDVPKPRKESLFGQLESLYKTFQQIGEGGEKVTFDLSLLSFAYPTLLLPISAYINLEGGEYDLGTKSKIESYLKFVSFPVGVRNVGEFEKSIQSYKTYIPISILTKDGESNLEHLESMFMDLITKVLKTSTGAQTAVRYPVGELVTNIFEHSKTGKGFLFGQYYPTKGFLDICILDRGRGLRQSYKEECDMDLSDTEAIRKALSGVSTKAGTERGYGLRTSKRMVCEGLGGEFALISGSAMMVSQKSENSLINLKNFNWKGVLIAYRIPKPQGEIDYTPYLEG
jgi:hypothetical protein